MRTSVLYLDDNTDLRELLAALIESALDVHCFTVSSVDELKENSGIVFQTNVAILDIELGFQQPTGIDAYRWLIESNYQGHIFFLTGHGRSHPLVQEATKSGVTIWEKPIGAEQITSAIQSLLQPKGPYELDPPVG